MQVDLVVQRKENCLIQYIDNDQFCAGNIYERKDTCNVSVIYSSLKLHIYVIVIQSCNTSKNIFIYYITHLKFL